MLDPKYSARPVSAHPPSVGLQPKQQLTVRVPIGTPPVVKDCIVLPVPSSFTVYFITHTVQHAASAETCRCG